MVTLPVVLGYVTFEQYGVWASISTFLALGSLADAGVSTQIVRKVAQAVGSRDRLAEEAAVREGVTVLAVIASGTLIVGLLCSALLPRVVGDVPGVTESQVIGLGAVVTVCVSLSLLLNGRYSVLKGLQRADLYAYGDLLGSLAQFMAMFAAFAAGLGLYALALGAVARLAVAAGAQQFSLRSLRPDARFPRPVHLNRRTFIGSRQDKHDCPSHDHRLD